MPDKNQLIHCTAVNYATESTILVLI
uniref:Uncharacterized protein n=1 Tax=Arundo donax TaxID=35708 RepID=A0A0A9BBQ2_ARUDO